MQQDLSLHDILLRSLSQIPEEVEPLWKYLKINESVRPLPLPERAECLEHELRKAGSNDLAALFRHGEGVSYEEIVLDVGKKLKADVHESRRLSDNEGAILSKLFEEAYNRMTPEERATLVKNLDLDVKGFDPLAPIGALVIQLALRQFGGFAVYRTSVIIANYVARALLGRGLAFAANAAVTRFIGAALGPVGWLVSGLWLAFDLAGPAYRKTVPAVVHVAYLRQSIAHRITFGVVGDGSTGKDAALREVFNIGTTSDPIAGTTSRPTRYKLADDYEVINFPGFNDIRSSVERETDELLSLVDVFIVVVDLGRGCSKVDVEIVNKVRDKGKPLFVCLNKCDIVRPEHFDKLQRNAQKRLRLDDGDFTLTAFEPRHGEVAGALKVRTWLREGLRLQGKAEEAIEAALGVGPSKA